MLTEFIAAIAFAIWLYLIAGRGGYWLATERDDRDEPPPLGRWPRVTVVIPARDEATIIGETVGLLLRQDYGGMLDLIVVDDNSSDGTAEVVLGIASKARARARVEVFKGRSLPPGWTGKVWAMKQGVDAAMARPERPDYILFTDADIAYAPRSVGSLVARAEAGDYVLTSLMANWRGESFAERCFIPAFIYFFQMLYPFAWVNRRDREIAAASGNCMLVRPAVLEAAGGVDAIRGALIDDCALGRILKPLGPVWLGLSERLHSIRPNSHVGDIRRMVARTAYAQLGYSPVRLAGAILGMGLTYLAPPLLTIFGSGLSQIAGATAWVLMCVSFQPTLRIYRSSPLWGIALPAIASAYMVFVLDSAYQHMRGRGGFWKGRAQAALSERK